MKILSFASLFALVLLISCSDSPVDNSSQELVKTDAYDLVNPFIGTGGHGHTYPGATLPFGMVQLSPDTRLEGWDGCSGYHYSDSVIYGFSHTHLSGTGVSDYGDILLSPFNSSSKVSLKEAMVYEKTKSSFNKKSEKAHPGYYEVKLIEANTLVQLTSTSRVGIHQYNFDGDAQPKLMVNLNHRDRVTESKITIEDSLTISGFRISAAWASKQQVYFVMHFSSPFEIIPFENEQDLFAQLRFKDKKIMTKVALSSTSVEGAKINMNAEADHWDFDKFKEKAKSTWSGALGKIEAKGRDEEALGIFYSALYHTMIAPNVISDVDGKYRGMDGHVHQNEKEDTYTIFSLWDTFRAAHPLYTIIEQDKTKAFLSTFMNQYQQGGKLPVWELAANETNCMIGYHSVSVIVDAYKKGLAGFDEKFALEAMTHSAELDEFGLEFYKKRGFIGAGDEPESVSKTLEYAYDDWCISEFAKMLNDTTVSETYAKRALSYQNLFDPNTKFLRARSNGDWFAPFDPAEVNFNYTEANAWQYSLFAPHDINGMIDLMGGTENFDSRLDDLFNAESKTTGREQSDITGLIGQYAHGNEPSHHMAYLYNFIGKPWKTQKMVHRILAEQYQNKPDGLSGNEDCGQMSAWYVLSAMGFYSVTPGLDYYVIGSPKFDEISINLENKNQFKITANNLSNDNIYIQSATLNGSDYSVSILKHNDIIDGGNLVFEMGPEPHKSWGVGTGNLPIAKVDNKSFIPVPYIHSDGITFNDSLFIEIGILKEDLDVLFAVDGGEYKVYQKPFTIYDNTEIYAFNEKSGAKSSIVKSQFKKLKKGRSIVLETEFANQYAAEGNNTLIDQLRGNTNYRTGYWQGYQGKDVVAVVDLGKMEDISKISVGCLQDVKSWIWYPKEIVFYTSLDGKSFQQIAVEKNTFSDTVEGGFIQDLCHIGNYNCRYVKVVVPNYGLCPDWHLGAGGESWLFLDEISID